MQVNQQPMGKILEKETLLNTTSNCHIYQMSCSGGPDAALNQCILNQRKKSEEAESLGALKRGTQVEVRMKEDTMIAKVVESLVEDQVDEQQQMEYDTPGSKGQESGQF